MVPRLSLPEKDLPYGVSMIRQNSVRETYPSHCHDFYEIFFVAEGKGTHCIGEQRLLLERGSLVLIRPDDVHNFTVFNYFDFSMYSMGFSVLEMHRALEYMDIPPVLADEAELPPSMVLHSQERAWIEREMDAILQLRPEQRIAPFRTMLPGLLHLLLNASETQQRTSEVFPAWLSRLDDEMSIQENYIQGLPRMQELCPYSQAYMNRVFKRYMKITPTEYINSKRMRYASELLLQGEHDIAEVCYRVGFNNLSHFYSVFRSIYHCTPKAFMGRKH